VLGHIRGCTEIKDLNNAEDFAGRAHSQTDQSCEPGVTGR